MPIHNSGDDRPKLKVVTNYGGKLMDPESREYRLPEYERNNGSTKNLQPRMKPLTPDGARAGKRPVVFHEDGTYSLPRGTTEWDYPDVFPDGPPKQEEFEPQKPKRRSKAKPAPIDPALEEANSNDLKKRNLTTKRTRTKE